MTIPTITEIKVAPQLSTEDFRAAIRNSISVAGFGSANYDQFEEYGQHWVIQHIWNPNKIKGRIFLDFCLDDSNPFAVGLKLKLYQDWSTQTHSGTVFSEGVSLDLTYDQITPYYPLDITVINHPEVKGFIWSQKEVFGSLYFLRPENIFNGYGYDDINYSWAFIANSDFDTVIETSNNPFQDNGFRGLELWSQLKFRNFNVNPPTHQIVPSPRILSPSQVGFLGCFSQDVCLVASNQVAWKTIFTFGVNSFLLLRPRNYSGFALALN